MKIEFYSTFPELIEDSDKYYYVFSILPNLCVDNKSIWFHWLFWGISIDYVFTRG
jgi:hypothetical protein